MKKILIFFLFAIVLLAIVSCKKDLEKRQICFKEKCFTVEVVKTKSDQARGLMYRRSIKPNEGMLFEYKEAGEHSIWMKNMNFPIDIIWLDENNKVLQVQESAPPCTKDFCGIYRGNKKSKYVVELPAGSMQMNNY